jgi:hypothetical protein
MILLAALLCNYGRGKCLIIIGTEGLVVRDEIQPLTLNDVAVLLTGFDRRESVVRELEINESFQFANMPSGFMSEALDDRVALLKTIGRRNV